MEKDMSKLNTEHVELTNLAAAANQQAQKQAQKVDRKKQSSSRYTGSTSVGTLRRNRRMSSSRIHDCEGLTPGEVDFYNKLRGFGFINYEDSDGKPQRIYFHAKGYRTPLISGTRIALNPNSESITSAIEDTLSSGKQVLFFKDSAPEASGHDYFAAAWCLTEDYQVAVRQMAEIPMYRLVVIDADYPAGCPIEQAALSSRQSWKGTSLDELSIHLMRNPLEQSKPFEHDGNCHVSCYEWRFERLVAGEWKQCENPLAELVEGAFGES